MQQQGLEKEDEGQQGPQEMTRTTGDGKNDNNNEDDGNNSTNPAPNLHGGLQVLPATPAPTMMMMQCCHHHQLLYLQAQRHQHLLCHQ
jgi:hypothetical protein